MLCTGVLVATLLNTAQQMVSWFFIRSRTEIWLWDHNKNRYFIFTTHSWTDYGGTGNKTILRSACTNILVTCLMEYWSRRHYMIWWSIWTYTGALRSLKSCGQIQIYSATGISASSCRKYKYFRIFWSKWCSYLWLRPFCSHSVAPWALSSERSFKLAVEANQELSVRPRPKYCKDYTLHLFAQVFLEWWSFDTQSRSALVFERLHTSVEVTGLRAYGNVFFQQIMSNWAKWVFSSTWFQWHSLSSNRSLTYFNREFKVTILLNPTAT